MNSSLINLGHARFNGGETGFSVTYFHEDREVTSGQPLRLNYLLEKQFGSGGDHRDMAVPTIDAGYVVFVRVSSDNAVAAWHDDDALMQRSRWCHTPSEFGVVTAREIGGILITWLTTSSTIRSKLCEKRAQELADWESKSVIDPERLDAIEELIHSLPAHDVLLKWASENPPPQEWFDEDYELL